MFENATDSVALLSVKRESAADDAYFQFATQASGGGMTERLRIGSSGQIGLSGANYGTSGQVLTSNGSGSAPTWQDTGTPTIASQAEAEAGTNNTNMMTPLRVKQAIDALGGNVIASIQRGTTAANNFPNSTTRNQSIQCQYQRHLLITMDKLLQVMHNNNLDVQLTGKPAVTDR